MTTPSNSWCIGAARFGAVLGGSSAVLGQLAVLYTDQGPSSVAWLGRVGAVGVDATLVGAVTFTAAWLTRRLARSQRGRTWGVVLTAALTAPIVAAQVLGFVLRGIFGSPFTLGGLDFFLASAGHMGRGLMDRYAAYTAFAAVLALLCVLSLAAGLSRAARSALSPKRLEIGVLVGAVALVAAGAVVRPTAIVESIAPASPAVAFFASIASASASASESDLNPAIEEQVLRALDSPPRIAGALWRKDAPLAEGPRPNVILLMLESVGIDHLGFEGYSRGVTPNLDALAERGRRFSRVWSTATHSNYAQMAVLSSLFPRRGSTLEMYHRLDYPRFLLHDALTNVGYSAATISSQDETWQGMLRFQQTGARVHYFHSPDHQGPHLDTGTDRIVPDELTIERALAWIEEPRSGSFSLYINLQSTHWPYAIPEDAERPFLPDTPEKPAIYASWSKDDLPRIQNRYDNALAYVDRQVGRLVAGLNERGLLADTLLVVTSDHGELFWSHELVTHGRTLFEGEARVPLIVSWPRVITPGVDDRPASNLDALPTIVDALDLPPFPGHQGRSLLRPEEPTAERRAVFLNIQGWRQAEAVVCWPYKLISEGSSASLYDLSSDPGEERDLAAELPATAASLGSLLRAQMTAQMRYHAPGRSARAERYAPRLLSCPPLTEGAADVHAGL